MLAIGLQGQGWPWPARRGRRGLGLARSVGLVNGLLVTRIKIDSFIATLGTGTMLYGLNAWYTGGQQVLASLPPEFLAISGNLWIVPAAGDLCVRRQPRACGSSSNICRSDAISTCSAPVRAPPNSMAFRRSAM